jgi:hypothetical protein
LLNIKSKENIENEKEKNERKERKMIMSRLFIYILSIEQMKSAECIHRILRSFFAKKALVGG